jgi:hypothetical protein
VTLLLITVKSHYATLKRPFDCCRRLAGICKNPVRIPVVELASVESLDQESGTGYLIAMAKHSWVAEVSKLVKEQRQAFTDMKANKPLSKPWKAIGEANTFLF